MGSGQSFLRASNFFADPTFPLAVVRISGQGAGALHGHEFHELVLIEGGKGRHLHEFGSYPVAAGDVFLITKSRLHGYDDVAGLSLVNILFDPERLALSLADLLNLSGYHVLFQIEPEWRRSEAAGRVRLGRVQRDEALTVVTSLEEELAAKRPGYQFMATAWLKLLIGQLARWGSDRRYVGGIDPQMLRMADLLSHIDRHYDEALSLAGMASFAAMSESSLQRAFRRITGTSPMDYVLGVRLDKAAHLLKQPGARVTDVAFACGFHDTNYFSRAFRKRRGVCPRELLRGVVGAAPSGGTGGQHG